MSYFDTVMLKNAVHIRPCLDQLSDIIEILLQEKGGVVHTCTQGHTCGPGETWKVSIFLQTQKHFRYFEHSVKF